MSDAQAAELEGRFSSLVPPPVEFVTNVHGDALQSILFSRTLSNYQFTPVTADTISIAVAAVGMNESALLIIADED